MEEKKIAIIGAGVSGLLACKYALEKGFNPIVFEARNEVGGVWTETIESTKLQTPKWYYQFSDYPWPDSVKETFPDHKQVMNYLKSYALHFNLFPCIKFNTRIMSIDYLNPSDQDLGSWDKWGGTGEPFSSSGRWIITLQSSLNPTAEHEVYQVDFVILCIGKFSDLPNMPDFPLNDGPEVFDGEVLHSMEYAAMADAQAAEIIKDKRVAVVGFQKSAVDLAAEIAKKNGANHPCTLLFRTVHWTVPESFLTTNFRNLNRFSELMIHKPGEGFFLWLLAVLLSPLLWIFSKFVEVYLRWTYPLKKFKMVPEHGFFNQISSCMFTVLPASFYDRVKEGSLILKKSKTFGFCRSGLIIDEEQAPVETDMVIFATGYKSDQKLMNVFTSTFFQKCIVDSTAPFYRECIHPRIPQLAILGYSESPAILYTTEMRCKWLAHFLRGNFKLPTIKEMEEDVIKWEKCSRSYAGKGYKRACVSVLLQIYCNDQICKDMGCNPRRKKWFLAELFAPYEPKDYAKMTKLNSIQSFEF